MGAKVNVDKIDAAIPMFCDVASILSFTSCSMVRKTRSIRNPTKYFQFCYWLVLGEDCSKRTAMKCV